MGLTDVIYIWVLASRVVADLIVVASSLGLEFAFKLDLAKSFFVVCAWFYSFYWKLSFIGFIMVWAAFARFV